jgi:hypothetical protein
LRTRRAGVEPLHHSSSPHRAGRGDAAVGWQRGRCSRRIPVACSRAGAIAEGLSRVRPFPPCPRRAPSSGLQRSPAVNRGRRLRPLTCVTAEQRAARQCFPSSRRSRDPGPCWVRTASRPLVLGGHERSRPVCENHRPHGIHASDLGQRNKAGPGSNPTSSTHLHDQRITRLVLCVDLVGFGRICPARVGCVLGCAGARRSLSDRLDDQADDQPRRDEPCRAPHCRGRPTQTVDPARPSARTPRPTPRSTAHTSHLTACRTTPFGICSAAAAPP